MQIDEQFFQKFADVGIMSVANIGAGVNTCLSVQAEPFWGC